MWDVQKGIQFNRQEKNSNHKTSKVHKEIRAKQTKRINSQKEQTLPSQINHDH
jgi:hypothetical protein